jgi:fructose-1,6-bisphosphatase
LGGRAARLGRLGRTGAHDRRKNELALRFGRRLLSFYTVYGEQVWIVIETDRTVMTILLSEEY